jgi:hypothetical protein
MSDVVGTVGLADKDSVEGDVVSVEVVESCAESTPSSMVLRLAPTVATEAVA